MFKAGARASTTVGDWGISVSGGGDVIGNFTRPRVQGRETWKLRAVAERRFSEKQRLLIEGSAASGSGGVTTALGQLHFTHDLRTIRVLYEHGDFRGQIYWLQGPLEGYVGTDLVFGGVRLAQFMPMMLLIGGRLRGSYATSDGLLSDEYDDISSPDYHRPGVAIHEGRAGAFVHGEFAPTDWVTITGGARVDINSTSGLFFSPRLAAVLRPAGGQFTPKG
jgi:hypothetical protein